MKRLLNGLLVGAAVTAMTGPAVAKKKKPKAQAPVSVQVENTCDAEQSLKVGDTDFKVAAKGKSEAQELAGREDWSFPIFLGDKKVDLGLLSLEAGGQYVVMLSGCTAAGADVATKNLAERPKGVSPEAAAQVRFRNRQRNPMEYKAGKVGRFMPLSVAMTRYKEQAGGEMEFTLRLRAAKRGPVLGMRKASTQIEAGHKYLVEANPVGRTIFYKFEDEGWVKP